MNNVDHPKHYSELPAECENCGHSIECINVVRHMGFNLGNAVKYIWRADHKDNAIEDLHKAIWYLQDEIKRRKNDKNPQSSPPSKSLIESLIEIKNPRPIRRMF